MKLYFALLFLLFSFRSYSQEVNPSDDRFIKVVEQSLNAFYADYANSTNYDSIMKALKYDAGYQPTFSDEVYCERLTTLNEMTDFEFLCNDPSMNIVKFFVAKRRDFIRVTLGRSALYFDLFEQKLASYNMPIELKYLAVIESGLRPQVRSRAGALGLWQFMYATGKYYGLNENTYFDERMDPEKATDAACRYLKKLHEIYNDWNLALAAYNAGPGNVNKAIRRSGGKKTYWEIRPFLPSETQGYVPNFIGAAYLMTYHKEHNIVPIPAKIHHAQLDTICLREGVKMTKISELVGWNVEEIKVLNPIYKTQYIPKTTPPQCITGPLEIIGKLVSVEEELYKKEVPVLDTISKDSLVDTARIDQNSEIGKIVLVESEKAKAPSMYVVQRGESLASISKDFSISVDDLVKWNNLKTTKLYAGQKLIVTGDKSNLDPVEVVKKVPPKPVIKYYNVRSGDNFSTVARRHGLTQTQLKKLNPGVNVSKLDIGQKLRVK